MKNMYLTSSNWMGEEKPTFKMIPITADCPYVECVFEPNNKILVILSAIKKQSYHMIPRMTADGDYEKRKVPANGKVYKEERRLVDSFQEYYIEEKAEILEFLKMFAINFDSFNLKFFFESPVNYSSVKEAPSKKKDSLKIVEKEAT